MFLVGEFDESRLYYEGNDMAGKTVSVVNDANIFSSTLRKLKNETTFRAVISKPLSTCEAFRGKGRLLF